MKTTSISRNEGFIAALMRVAAMLALVIASCQAATVPSTTCKPPNLSGSGIRVGNPPGASLRLAGDVQDICQSLVDTPDRVFAALYSQAIQPASINGSMPAGCTAGCIVGDSTGADWTREQDNWGGKCFTNFESEDGAPSELRNIITPQVSTIDWDRERFVDGRLMMPGDIEISDSWTGQGRALSLDYTEVPQQPFSQIEWNDFRDEMRELAPGIWLGQIWTKPRSSSNPSNQPVPGSYFLIFQTCTSDGAYPTTAMERDFRLTQPEAASLLSRGRRSQPGRRGGRNYMSSWISDLASAFGVPEEINQPFAGFASAWMDQLSSK